MKVKELIAQLNELILVNPKVEDEEIRIIVKRSSPAIGPRSSVGVKSITSGFDWESGKLLVVADETILAGEKSLEAAAKFARKVRDAMYWRQSGDDTRQKNANALASIERALDEWLPDRSEKKSDPA